jgi:hypothetical protein
MPMITLEREVTATRAEFVRGLQAAFPGRVEEIAERLRIDDGRATMEISLTALPDRRIALLRLPNLRVHIRFTQGTRADQEAMLAYMDRATHRGGG